MSAAYYNENDAEKAEWLRELIRRKVVADGIVDTRSIANVEAKDIQEYAQCHFFAGIGVWSYALRLAGWPDDRPVWTGSCPCPSFSAAGKGAGFDDPRHLWPDWYRLVRVGKPATIFGEQADDAIGYGWLNLVQTDLERENYAVGKAVLGACSVGAPHIRQRLFFVGSLEHAARERQSFGTSEACRKLQGEALSAELRSGDAGRMGESNGAGSQPGKSSATGNGHGSPAIAASAAGVMGNAQRDGRKQSAEDFCRRQSIFSGAGENVGMGNANRSARAELPGSVYQSEEESNPAWFGNGRERDGHSGAGHVNGFWRNADWILRKRWNSDHWEWCPTEPGTFPLVAGASCRVLRLRGYGDAIVPQVAAEFIQTYLEVS
jgi:DNA (cytosine-5)-methyltransferase 1